VFSARSLFGIAGTAVIDHRVFSSVVFDLAQLGLDANVVMTLVPSRWSPYVGLGGHVSFKRLGVDTGIEQASINDDPDLAHNVFALHARAEVGAQFVAASGFSLELGLALIGYRKNGRVSGTGLPVIHLGWLF
jgi:hypothetical protein